MLSLALRAFALSALLIAALVRTNGFSLAYFLLFLLSVALVPLANPAGTVPAAAAKDHDTEVVQQQNASQEEDAVNEELKRKTRSNGENPVLHGDSNDRKWATRAEQRRLQQQQPQQQ